MTTTTLAVPTSCADRGGADPGVRGAGRGAQREHLDRPRRADGRTDRGVAGAGGSTWVAAALATAPPQAPEVQDVLDEIEANRHPHKVARNGAAARIVEQLEQSGLEKVMLDGVRPVEPAIRYFRARLPRMEYAAARREGLPIGSGNVEATCKSLVTVRRQAAGRPMEAHDG